MRRSRTFTPSSLALLAVTLLVLTLLAAACSGSVNFSVGGQSITDAAEELIESDEMFRRLNVDPIVDAVCDEPEVEAVGEVFACTATSGDNEINFEVQIDSEDSIFASPTNVLEDRVVPAYAASAVDALNTQNGFSLSEGSLDCGAKSVVLDADNKMQCLLTDPATDTVFNVELTVRDLETAAFGVEIIDVAE